MESDQAFLARMRKLSEAQAHANVTDELLVSDLNRLIALGEALIQGERDA